MTRNNLVAALLLMGAVTAGNAASSNDPAPGHQIVHSSTEAASAVLPVTTISNPKDIPVLTGDPGSDDSFGYAIAQEGDRALVGAPNGRSDSGARVGEVYVYERTVAGWQQVQRLAAPDGVDGDRFGHAVAVRGDLVVIGAPSHTPGAGFSKGAVYVYRLSAGSWQFAQKLVLTTTDTQAGFAENFLLGDGEIYVGASLLDRPGLTNAGAALRYIEQAGNWVLAETIVSPDPLASDSFGAQMTFARSQLLVAAPAGRNLSAVRAGVVHGFDRIGGVWQPAFRLEAAGGISGDNFGRALAADDARVLVGAPFADRPNQANLGSLFLFEWQTSAWQEAARVDGANGLSRLGSQIALGSDHVWARDESGTLEKLRRFEIGAQSLTETAQVSAWDGFDPDNPGSSDEFGFDISLVGGRLLVGATQARTDHLFRIGAFYEFSVGSGSNEPIEKVTPKLYGGNDNFGVSIDTDGETLVIGAYNADTKRGRDAGAAYVYHRSANGWQLEQELVPTIVQPFEQCGAAVAVYGDTIAVGCPYARNGLLGRTGWMYVFRKSGGIWQEEAKLLSPAPQAEERFASELDIYGDTIVVGAPEHNGPAGGIGAVFAWQRNGNSWFGQQLTPPVNQSGLLFGAGLDLDDSGLLVGAAGKNNGPNMALGAAYLLTGNGTSWSHQQALVPDPLPAGFDVMAETVSRYGNQLWVSYSDAVFPFLLRDGMWQSLPALLPPVPENEFGGRLALANYYGVAIASTGCHVMTGSDGNWSAIGLIPRNAPRTEYLQTAIYDDVAFCGDMSADALASGMLRTGLVKFMALPAKLFVTDFE